MPYRLDPSDARCVQVQREEGWQRLKCHETAEAAGAHLAALSINVEDRLASGTFAKLDDEQQIAFGWAYTARVADTDVVDHSGDFVDSEALPALETAVYDFVLKSRTADEMHERFGGVATLVESVMLTPEKLQAMGIEGKRIGWWVGFKVLDTDVWAKVKDGTYADFSIRGRGRREDVSDG